MNPIREFEYRLMDDTIVKGSLNHKFNIVTGDSATGKTTLLNNLNSGNNSNQLKPLDFTVSNEDFSTSDSRIRVVDTNDFNVLWSRTDVREAMQKSEYFYLIFTKFTIPQLNVSDDAIYTFVKEGNIITLKHYELSERSSYGLIYN